MKNDLYFLQFFLVRSRFLLIDLRISPIYDMAIKNLKSTQHKFG